jgi:hypothetical protein
MIGHEEALVLVKVVVAVKNRVRKEVVILKQIVLVVVRIR